MVEIVVYQNKNSLIFSAPQNKYRQNTQKYGGSGRQWRMPFNFWEAQDETKWENWILQSTYFPV